MIKKGVGWVVLKVRRVQTQFKFVSFFFVVKICHKQTGP